MKKRYIAIAGLLLPEVIGWEFAERDGVIVGRGEGPGRLQILHASQEALPQPVTHDFCLSVLRSLLGTTSDPTDRQLHESICGPYGAATFIRAIEGENSAGDRERGENEVVRAWYCRRPTGLIYGIHTCRQSSARGPAYEMVSRQCARIMADVLYDRVAWGAADDPLTRVLQDEFERLEVARVGRRRAR